MNRSHDAQYYVAVFKPALIAAACRGAGYEGLKRKNVKHGTVLHTLLDPATFDLIRKTMDTMMVDGLDPDILNREAGFGVGENFSFEHGDPDGLNAGLRHLLLWCWRSQHRRPTQDGAVALHPSVRKALELLGEGEWDESFGRLARRCGMSEAYLSRIFARQVGVPLSRYRNSARLGRFLEHYRQPEQKTITEAVYAAGFGSYAQFYKVFAEAYGCGPRSGLLDASFREPAVAAGSLKKRPRTRAVSGSVAASGRRSSRRRRKSG